MAKKKSEDTAGAALSGCALIIGLILIAIVGPVMLQLSDQSWGHANGSWVQERDLRNHILNSDSQSAYLGVRSFSFILCGLNSGGRE